MQGGLRSKIRTGFSAALAAWGLVFLPSLTAEAESVSIDLNCPDTALPGSTPEISVVVENRFCSPQTVRLLSSVVGNANGTVEGVGIVGPHVAVASSVLPAATDLTSTCTNGSCSGINGFRPCTTSLDCVCARVSPGTATIQFDLETPIPAVFADSVIQQYTFLDIPGSAFSESSSCYVEVPEPRTATGIWIGLAALAVALSHKKNTRYRRVHF